MVVMILEKVPPSLKGDMSRWLMEVRSGVYLGHVSALVRELLFSECVKKMRDGGVMMIFPAQTEQGFRIETAGNLSREIVDFDGLLLPRTRKMPKRDGSDEDQVNPLEPPF